MLCACVYKSGVRARWIYAEKKRQIETNKKEGEATSLFRVLSFLSFGTLNRRPLERPKKLFTCTIIAREYYTIS